MATVNNITKSLADIRKMVYFMLSESSNSTIFTTESVNTAINIALANVSKIVNRSKRRITTNTVAGTREYEIPDASLQFGRALINECLIDGTAITAALDTYDDGVNGEPTEYYVTGRSIGLQPTPDAIYAISILYSMEYQDMTADADVTDMSDVFINAAILYVCYLLKLKDEEFGSSDRFLEAYDRAIKAATQIQSGVYRGSTAITYGGTV
jgi:hypothetical protein